MLLLGSGQLVAAAVPWKRRETLVAKTAEAFGLRWREAAGQAILSLRGWVQRCRFEAAWALIAATYRDVVRSADDV